jgi:monoamine oxidase
MGHTSELLAKAVNKQALSDEVTKEDAEILLEALRDWGSLDKNLRYVKGPESSDRRGWAKNPGGGLSAYPEASEPMTLDRAAIAPVDRPVGRFWHRTPKRDLPARGRHGQCGQGL